MGKAWDHGVPGEAFWREALRVAKPGAHLVAFGGTRTYHRLTCAIEDAGWEIRDCLSWLYGSGFPKSHDVSKAIDKMDAAEEQSARRYRFTEWVRSTGVTSAQIDSATDTNMGGHYTTAASQPAIMTREHLEKCRHLLGGVDVPEWVERECDIRSVESRNFAEREVVGRDTKARSTGGSSALPTLGAGVAYKSWDITAPATDLARQWQGWGTALKPAWEPIILARKPLIGTVAANVAQYGTGGINVDGCRLTPVGKVQAKGRGRGELGQTGGWNAHANKDSLYDGTQGRWPANVVLDEEAAGMLDEQSGERKSAPQGKRKEWSGYGGDFGFTSHAPSANYGDSGGASRFFYTAKASRKEREAGLEGMPVGQPVGGADKWTETDRRRGEGVTREPAANVHPTVKPIALMRWLCRLVTPKGGLILDPFTGSGTTGCAAVLEGFRFVGIERESEYVEIAEKRIAHWASAEPDLFAVAL
jgi:hypothetical protein